jgi:rod shape-determining protein MreC
MQWNVMRALRASVLYPASVVDNAIRDVARVRTENAVLRRELARARTPLAAASGTAPELAPSEASEWTPARVIGRGRSADGNWNYLTVRVTGAANDSATVAFTADGLVGAVVERGLGTMTVRSITAPESAVHVLNQRSRVAGVLRPEADVGTGLRLHHVPAQEDVAVGDTLITSGLGRLFPPDVPVGRVTRIETPDGALVRDVWVEPFVRLARVEHVFLVARRPPW